MENFLKKIGWSSIVTSAITAIIGIVIICNPMVTMKLVAYALGSIFVVFGVIKLVNYFVAKGTYDFYNYEMIYGLLAIIIGIITILLGIINFKNPYLVWKLHLFSNADEPSESDLSYIKTEGAIVLVIGIVIIILSPFL